MLELFFLFIITCHAFAAVEVFVQKSRPILFFFFSSLSVSAYLDKVVLGDIHHDVFDASRSNCISK